MTKVHFDRCLGRAALAALLVGLSLSSCSEARRAFGYDKSAPDEFAVVSRAPLSQPPDFSLRPPKPGAARPQEATTRDQARAALFSNRGGSDANAFPGRSAGEQILLTKAGADKALPDIRKVVNEETSALIEADESFTDEILFWQKKPEPGEPINAKAENQRLQTNASLGKPINEGDTPKIERRNKGWLEGIF
jgi:hypothetical protein